MSPPTNTNTLSPSAQTLIVDMSNNTVGIVSESIIEKQNQMNTIITNEMNRLDSKKSVVDDIIGSKERLIQLNTNDIERKQEYQKMMIAVIVGLAICIILYKANDVIPIPSVIKSLILIITFSGVFIFCFNSYLIIVNRDNMDFEKIYISPPVINANKLGQSSAGNNGNLLGDLMGGVCFGSSCCSDKTLWDASAALCRVNPIYSKEGFDPLLKVNADCFKVVTQTTSLPYYFTPNEFDNYSIY